jgi:hypothetical protein
MDEEPGTGGPHNGMAAEFGCVLGRKRRKLNNKSRWPDDRPGKRLLFRG